jgi:hypothetical protein
MEIMKEYKIVEANDVTHNLTFYKSKFSVKKLLNLVSNSSSSL